jgi:flagellar FliL protein
MAKQEERTEDGDDTAPTGTGAGLGRWLTIGAVVLVVMGASIGGTLYFVGGSDTTEDDVEAQAPAPKQVAIYHNMRPAFVVNFLAGNKPRYLQAELTVMARDPKVIEAVITHTPLIRSEIINAFASQDYATLQTTAGKEALRETLRQLIDDTISREAKLSGIETVLLTNFVMQ